MEKAPTLRPVIWLGDSRKNILAFPEKVRKLIGDELQLIQFGGLPRDAKLFKGVAPMVIEIALRHDKEAYRCVLAIRLGETIYVLHAFQKKSKQGVSTPKQHIDLIRRRYTEARELENNEQQY